MENDKECVWEIFISEHYKETSFFLLALLKQALS
jgi:hypothetical protein